MKYMYGMNNYGKLFAGELTEWFIEEGFIQYKFQILIYYNYAPNGKIFLFYLMLIIVYIGIHLKLSKKFLFTI